MFAFAIGVGTAASVVASYRFSQFAACHHAEALLRASRMPTGPTAEALTAHADRHYLQVRFGMMAFQAGMISAVGYYIHRDTELRGTGFVIGGVLGLLVFEGSFRNSNFLRTLAK